MFFPAGGENPCGGNVKDDPLQTFLADQVAQGRLDSEGEFSIDLALAAARLATPGEDPDRYLLHLLRAAVMSAPAQIDVQLGIHFLSIDQRGSSLAADALAHLTDYLMADETVLSLRRLRALARGLGAAANLARSVELLGYAPEATCRLWMDGKTCRPPPWPAPAGRFASCASDRTGRPPVIARESFASSSLALPTVRSPSALTKSSCLLPASPACAQAAGRWRD
jgi:hypothetical protein